MTDSTEIPFEHLPEGIRRHRRATERTRRRIRRHRHATKRTVYQACFGSYFVRPHGRGYRIVWAASPDTRLAHLIEGWQGVQEAHSPRISDAIFRDLFAPPRDRNGRSQGKGSMQP